ncbi:MAG: glycoside hydrolase family 88 protein [Ignavibacteriae bacterium]|nr:glycoside hydrolase family 88 protein [Ignavibacteriota bacterium]
MRSTRNSRNAYLLFLAITLPVLVLSCAPSRTADHPTARRIVDPSLPWSARIAQSFVLRHPGGVSWDSLTTSQAWNYEHGLMLVALHKAWQHTGDGQYFEFIKQNMDRFIAPDGSIRTYKRTEFNLDQIAAGRALFPLLKASGEQRFMIAADTLRQQLRDHPRTKEGGFWHKEIYPWQMWLDGLYMAEPFYATYAVMHNDTAAFTDIVRQFRYVHAHTKDQRTGLLYHAWDESRSQRWADPKTGQSPNFWSRAMGWYMMALVDVLDILPPAHPGRAELIALLRDAAPGIANHQDPATGLWWQVTDQPGREGNYLEASGSAMFAYAFARGVQRGWLDPAYGVKAKAAFEGLTTRLVTVSPEGFVDLHETCRSAGLGGKPYRDGSYAYYISEPRRLNDFKGVGPFLLAAIALEEGWTK